MSQLFFGGGGGSGMLPLENLGFSYSQIPEGLSKIMLLKRRIDLQDIIAIYLCWPSSWRYLDLLHRKKDEKKDETAVPALSVLFLFVFCEVNFTRSISLVVMSLQY